MTASHTECIGQDRQIQSTMGRKALDPKPIPGYELDEFRGLIEAKSDTLLSHPCIVRGFNQQWLADERWGSMDYLSVKFGHLPVTAGAPQFTTHANATMCQVMTDFGTYLKYVADPSSVEVLFDGKWSKGDSDVYRALNMPLYCGNMRLARHAREEVFNDLQPIVPAGIEYLNDDIPYYYQSGNHLWLYVSLAGALTPLHQDNNAVIAYLAQLRGHKDAILYSPEDKPHFHNPAVGYFDPLNPNDSEFPTWRQAQPWMASLSPGDFLIWGPNWAHHVVTRSNSVTVSFDIVNDLNLDAYTASMDWRVELGLFAKKNADLIRSRIQAESVLQALDQGVEETIGRELMLCVLRAALANDLTPRSRMVKERMLRTLEAG